MWTAQRGFASICPSFPTTRRAGSPGTRSGAGRSCDTRLVIDRGRFTATLYRAGRIIFRTRVGVGAPGTPTPAGQFYVRDRLRGFSSPIYGPLAFGTNARSPTLTDWPGGAVVGIHGTDQPGSDPRTDLARLRPAYERRDPQARDAHAGRHSGDDRMSRRHAIVAVIAGAALRWAEWPAKPWRRLLPPRRREAPRLRSSW